MKDEDLLKLFELIDERMVDLLDLIKLQILRIELLEKQATKGKVKK